MKIFLALLFLTESVLGDKLSRGYLPPPGAHLSAGDLNYSDLPLELPSHEVYTKYTDLKTTPGLKEKGNYFIGPQGSEPVSFDIDFNTPTSSTPASATTTNSVSEYISTPSTQVPTLTDFIYDTTESKFPQIIHQSHRVHEPFSYGDVNKSNSTGVAIPVSGIEEKYSFSPMSSLSNFEPNTMFANQISNMDYYYPTINSGKEVEIEGDQKQYDTYSPRLYEPNLSSARRMESQNNDRNAIITEQNNNLKSDGFSYSFDTSNGINTDVIGTAKDGIKTKGSFSYTGDDGKVYKMEYTADENGFRPSGAHLPTPPPIPKEIQKVIEQAYINKAAGIVDDGSYNEEKYGYKNYMPHNDNKATKQNKGLLTKKTIVEPTNIFDDNLNNINRPRITSNVPLNNRIIPVQVIYDQGYRYDRPQNKLHSPEAIGKETEINSSPIPQIRLGSIKSMDNVNDANSYNNSPNNDTNNSEKPNLFGPTDEVRIYENNQPNKKYNYESENYKSTIFPTTYYTNFNHLNGDPSSVTDSQAKIMTNLPTTATPNFSIENASTEPSFKSTFMSEDDEVISTGNPKWVTAASPRTQTMPVYTQTQVRGEDFSGPKQLPTYNPKYGYYY
ncbi:unnamed protein product [Pieris macdunnoughi]|uniref:Uncharacterized protein n=1 Tax=Pieris macdunnoughi TaxID=345717 RepID=A0A821TKF3_9NEOP|nr:unnamed protein product [Pieris macdunnoughi]